MALASHERWEASVRLKSADLRRADVDAPTRLLRHRDVLVLRLVHGHPTLVHRDLWPDLLAIAISGSPWQVEWLPPKDARLLEVVDEEGVVRLDQALAERLDASPRHLGKALLARLLVLGTLEPDGRGTARTLVSWWRWAEEERVAPTPDEAQALARLEAASRGLSEHYHLPWFRRGIRHRWGW